jgi:hypothetical protein
VLLSKEYMDQAILSCLLGVLERPTMPPGDIVIALSAPNLRHTGEGTSYSIVMRKHLQEHIESLLSHHVLPTLRTCIQLPGSFSSKKVEVTQSMYEPEAEVHIHKFFVTYPIQGNWDQEVVRGVERFLTQLLIAYRIEML